MGPTLDPVYSDGELPTRVDVAIIGGGIVGTSIALFLARKGVSVALCEKGEIGGEQSSRNWGWCRTIGRDLRELPLAMESLCLWGSMNELTGAETGFRAAGIAYLCEDATALARHENWLSAARSECPGFYPTARIVGTSEVAAIASGSARSFAGALHAAADGRAEPQKAAPAIANAARQAGATVVTRCAVRSLDIEAGRVAGVWTEKSRIRCSIAVLAGGAWARLFCSRLGFALPLLKSAATALRTSPIDGPNGALMGPGFGMRRRLDGGYTIAIYPHTRFDIVPDSFRFLPQFMPLVRSSWRELRPRLGAPFFDEWRQALPSSSDETTIFEEVRVLDPAPEQALNRRAFARAKEVFPSLDGAQIVQQWGGVIDVTPDAIPVISATDAVPGFFIATGFSGTGFGLGPGAGQLMAQLVTAEQPSVDPRPFRLSRFFDGSTIRVQMGW